MADQNEDVFERVKQEYMDRVYAEIRTLAQKKAGSGPIQAIDAYRAFEEYFGSVPRRESRGIAGFMSDNVFLFSAIFLTVVFGLFGLYHPDETEVSSFLDIAKIFAGAVVGGAAGSTAAAYSRRRSAGNRASQ